jgi:glycosyltransferase involved in cell wall biosynthesis
MVEHGASGLLVDYGDVDGMAAALVEILRDGQLRLQMGQRGREMAKERYRSDAVAGKTREAYLRLSQTGRKSSSARS